MSRTYIFSLSFVGKGETLEEAWGNAVSQAELEKTSGADANPELFEVSCKKCSGDCKKDGENVWICRDCGTKWKITDKSEKDITLKDLVKVPRG